MDKGSTEGEGGWAGFGPDNYIHTLRPGTTDFDTGLVAFDIIDSTANQGKACIVLSGPRREKAFPKSSPPIAVNRKAAALFFLHTTMFARGKNAPLIRYRIAYKDGSEEIFTCLNKVDVGNWYISWKNKRPSNAWIALNDRSRCLMMTPWKNPIPDKVIKSITMESTGQAIPILVGITAADTLVEYHALRKIMEFHELSSSLIVDSLSR